MFRLIALALCAMALSAPYWPPTAAAPFDMGALTPEEAAELARAQAVLEHGGLMNNMPLKNHSYCGYYEPARFPGQPFRAYSLYFLLADDGWTTDCGALGARVAARCPGLRHVNATGPEQALLCNRKRETRRVIIGIAANNSTAGCGADAITGVSPAAQANNRTLPTCIPLHQHA
jgi:hypothetical protein